MSEPMNCKVNIEHGTDPDRANKFTAVQVNPTLYINVDLGASQCLR
jgi:hypothetical protein